MCSYRPPFVARNFKELRRSVMVGVYPPLPSIYSDDINILIRSLLSINPNDRPSSNGLINNVYIVNKMKKLLKRNESSDLCDTNHHHYNLMKTIRMKDIGNLKIILPQPKYEYRSISINNRYNISSRRSNNDIHRYNVSSHNSITDSIQHNIIDNNDMRDIDGNDNIKERDDKKRNIIRLPPTTTKNNCSMRLKNIVNNDINLSNDNSNNHIRSKSSNVNIPSISISNNNSVLSSKKSHIFTLKRSVKQKDSIDQLVGDRMDMNDRQVYHTEDDRRVGIDSHRSYLHI